MKAVTAKEMRPKIMVYHNTYLYAYVCLNAYELAIQRPRQFYDLLILRNVKKFKILFTHFYVVQV